MLLLYEQTLFKVLNILLRKLPVVTLCVIDIKLIRIFANSVLYFVSEHWLATTVTFAVSQ